MCPKKKMKYSKEEMLEYIRAEKMETMLVSALFCNSKDYVPMFGEISQTEKGFLLSAIDKPRKIEELFKKGLECQDSKRPEECFSVTMRNDLDEEGYIVDNGEERSGTEECADIKELYQLLKEKPYVETCVVFAGGAYHLLADIWNEEPEEEVAAKNIIEHVFLDFIERNHIDTKGRWKAVLDTAKVQYQNFCNGQMMLLSKGLLKRV